MNRVESLDYLRGIMAFSVMLYHYLNVSYGPLGSQYTIGKLGIYAISTFYVLSGLCLTIVYKNKFSNFSEYFSYSIKRIFRIVPLWWLASSLTTIMHFINAQIIGKEFGYDFFDIVLNYTLLFGFFKPSAYIPAGGWSIGNEMVFYAFFPIMIILGRNKRFNIVCLLTFFLVFHLIFAFNILQNSASLSDQWKTYINPFNHIFLFFSGVAIGLLWIPNNSKKFFKIIALILLSILFVIFPVSGDKIELVTRVERLYFSFISISFCYFLYSSNIKFNNILGKFLKILGETSYSIYILHPLVTFPIVYITRKLNIELVISLLMICVPLTFVISYWSYKYVEKPMMLFGSKISKLYRN